MKNIEPLPLEDVHECFVKANPFFLWAFQIFLEITLWTYFVQDATVCSFPKAHGKQTLMAPILEPPFLICISWHTRYVKHWHFCYNLYFCLVVCILLPTVFVSLVWLTDQCRVVNELKMIGHDPFQTVTDVRSSGIRLQGTWIQLVLQKPRGRPRNPTANRQCFAAESAD
jgi:hypothetical protein